MTEAINFGARSLRALRRIYSRRHYTVLFYALLLTMATAPLYHEFGWTGAVLEWFLAATLLAGMLPVGTTRSRRVLLPIAALVWLARPLTSWLDHPALSAMTLGVWTVMGIIAAVYALRFAMGATKVDAEHLYAALSAYLLAGIFFGLFYWMLEQISPGTFTSAGDFSRMSAFYFSFVTLATLGYGDIVPRSDIARGLAMVEGVGGQLFLAVMVARLVSLYGREQPRIES